MLPDFNIAGLYLYDIFFALGIIAALIILRVYGDKKNMPGKVMNFYLILSAAAIIAGCGFSVLFQALYNGIATGDYSVNSGTGMTFLGGLIGGGAVFLAGYYILGNRIFKEREHKLYFNMLLSIAPCAITLAHALGRLGCFTAGCCHGKHTDSFLGINFNGIGKVYPTQLFECVFLLGLFAVLSVLYFKDKGFNMPLYMVSYGIFRFLIEFLRGDERGAFFIKALSPSQGTAILLTAGGAAWLIIYFFKRRKISAGGE